MPIHLHHHDSPLGRWLLARWQPSALRGVVEGIWYFEGSLSHLRERHFPTGRLEMVVHLGPVYRQVNGRGADPFPEACISGLLLGPEVIEAPPGPSAVLGVRFQPLGAYAALGAPVHTLTGSTADLRDVTGTAAAELLERCGGASTPRARLREAASWIEERYRRGPLPDPAVAWMVRRIEERAGALSIRELRERTGWSRTRITGAFREQVGVTPKVLARLMRFRRALELLGQGDRPLVRVALDAGYYDQSHFHNEFRALSGFTPTGYRQALRFPDSPSLAEHPD